MARLQLVAVTPLLHATSRTEAVTPRYSISNLYYFCVFFQEFQEPGPCAADPHRHLQIYRLAEPWIHRRHRGVAAAGTRRHMRLRAQIISRMARAHQTRTAGPAAARCGRWRTWPRCRAASMSSKTTVLPIEPWTLELALLTSEAS